jgi:hypothetical protein
MGFGFLPSSWFVPSVPSLWSASMSVRDNEAFFETLLSACQSQLLSAALLCALAPGTLTTQIAPTP